jgi:hypothetical protein
MSLFDLILSSAASIDDSEYDSTSEDNENMFNDEEYPSNEIEEYENVISDNLGDIASVLLSLRGKYSIKAYITVILDHHRCNEHWNYCLFFVFPSDSEPEVGSTTQNAHDELELSDNSFVSAKSSNDSSFHASVISVLNALQSNSISESESELLENTKVDPICSSNFIASVVEEIVDPVPMIEETIKLSDENPSSGHISVENSNTDASKDDSHDFVEPNNVLRAISSDDRPISVSHRVNDQFLEEANELESTVVTDLDNEPLISRLFNTKSASARRSGYTELARTIHTVDISVFAENGGLYTVIYKGLQDTIALVNEATILLLQTMIQDSKYLDIVVPKAIDILQVLILKGLLLNKSTVTDQVVAIILQLSELASCSSWVLHSIDSSIKTQRNKKVIASYLRLLASLIPKMQNKPNENISNFILVNSTSKDKMLIDASISCFVCIVEKFGPSSICSLPASLQNEILTKSRSEKSFDDVGIAPRNAMSLDVIIPSQNETSSNTAEKGDMSPEEIEMAEQAKDEAYISAGRGSNVLELVASLDLETRFRSTKKWNEKVAIIDDLYQRFNLAGPKFAGDGVEYSNLIGNLKLFLLDSHIVVQTKVLDVLSLIGSKLRDRLATSSLKSLVPILLEKMKERKGTLITATSSTLLAFLRYSCVSLDDFIDSVSSVLCTKTSSPEQRKNIVALLTNVISNHRTLSVNSLRSFADQSKKVQGSSGPQRIKNASINTSKTRSFLTLPVVSGSNLSGALLSLVDLLFSCCSDSTVEVRLESERAIGALIRRLGDLDESVPMDERPSFGASAPCIAEHMDVLSRSSSASVDRIKLAAGIISASQYAIHHTSSGAIPSATSTAAVAKLDQKRSSSNVIPSISQVETTSSIPVDADYEAAISIEVGSLPSLDEVLEAVSNGKLGASFNGSHVAMLESSKWQERKAAVDTLADSILKLPAENVATTKSVELAIMLMSYKTNSFKIANSIVLVSVVDAINYFVKMCNKSSCLLSRKIAAVVLDGLSSSLKEKRGGNEIATLLVQIAGLVGPNFVFSRLESVSKTCKQPIIQSSILEFFTEQLIPKFGILRLKLIPFLCFLTSDIGLNSATPTVKQAAIGSFCALHKQAGPMLFQMLAYRGMASVDQKVLELLKKECTIDAPEGTSRGNYSVESAKGILQNTLSVVGEQQTLDQSKLFLENQAAGAKITSINTIFSCPQEKLDIIDLLSKDIFVDLDVSNESNTMGKQQQPSSNGSSSNNLQRLASSSSLTSVLNDSKAKPWQVRMNALDEVIRRLTNALSSRSVSVIFPSSNLSSLVAILKRRLTDTQVNNRQKAVQCIVLLSRVIGSNAFSIVGKSLLHPMLELCGDKSERVRSGIVLQLQEFISSPPDATHAPFLSLFSSALASPGGVLSSNNATHIMSSPSSSTTATSSTSLIRETLIPMFLSYAKQYIPLEKTPTVTTCFSLSLPALCDWLGDKSSSVRKLAVEFAPILIFHTSSDALLKVVSNLKPAMRMTIEPAVKTSISTAKSLQPSHVPTAPQQKAEIKEQSDEHEGEIHLDNNVFDEIIENSMLDGDSSMLSASSVPMNPTLEVPIVRRRSQSIVAMSGKHLVADVSTSEPEHVDEKNGQSLVAPFPCSFTFLPPTAKEGRSRMFNASSWSHLLSNFVETVLENPFSCKEKAMQLHSNVMYEWQSSKAASKQTVDALFVLLNNQPSSWKSLETALEYLAKVWEDPAEFGPLISSSDLLLKYVSSTLLVCVSHLARGESNVNSLPFCPASFVTVLCSLGDRLSSILIALSDDDTSTSWKGLTRYDGEIILSSLFHSLSWIYLFQYHSSVSSKLKSSDKSMLQNLYDRISQLYVKFASGVVTNGCKWTLLPRIGAVQLSSSQKFGLSTYLQEILAFYFQPSTTSLQSSIIMNHALRVSALAIISNLLRVEPYDPTRVLPREMWTDIVRCLSEKGVASHGSTSHSLRARIMGVCLDLYEIFDRDKGALFELLSLRDQSLSENKDDPLSRNLIGENVQVIRSAIESEIQKTYKVSSTSTLLEKSKMRPTPDWLVASRAAAIRSNQSSLLETSILISSEKPDDLFHSPMKEHPRDQFATPLKSENLEIDPFSPGINGPSPNAFAIQEMALRDHFASPLAPIPVSNIPVFSPGKKKMMGSEQNQNQTMSTFAKLKEAAKRKSGMFVGVGPKK